VAAVKFCAICGSPTLGPHCDNARCTWWKCRKCGSVGDVEGLAVIDNRPKKEH